MQLQPQHSPKYGNIRDAVRRCEDIGVDIAYNWDHFYPLYGDADGAHFECWTMLGAWAEQTSRIEFGAAGGRLDELAVALPRIKSRFAKLNPAPTRDIPILIGGQGEKKTLRMVAEYATTWHGFVDQETYPRKAEILAAHCEAVGRDPATIERSAGVQARLRSERRRGVVPLAGQPLIPGRFAPARRRSS